MVIDFLKDPDHARHFDCLDADTGQYIDSCFYADDESGVYRVHLRDDRGLRYYDPARKDIAWEERRGRIKVIPREEPPRSQETGR